MADGLLVVSPLRPALDVSDDPRRGSDARSRAKPEAKTRSYDAGKKILDSVRKLWPWLKHLFADGAQDCTKLMDKAAFLDLTVEIIRRSDAAQGFEVLPRRRVVERTFGWMTRWRRLVRDYEERLDCSDAMIHVALGSLLRRIALK